MTVEFKVHGTKRDDGEEAFLVIAVDGDSYEEVAPAAGTREEAIAEMDQFIRAAEVARDQLRTVEAEPYLSPAQSFLAGRLA